MSRRLRVMSAIWRKDFLVLWPLVAMLLVLQVVRSGFLVHRLPDFARELSTGVGALACLLLILGVIHQDASASVRHDWLTKPIPRGSMAVAKLALIAICIYLPAMTFEYAYELHIGHSAKEAFLHATTINGRALGSLLTLVMLAVVTSTLLEAAGAFVAIFVVAMIVQLIAALVGDQVESMVVGGLIWLQLFPFLVLPLLLIVPVTWLQYSRRRTMLARTLVAVAAVASFLPLLLSWNAMFAIQKIAAGGSSENQTGLALVPGCFDSMAIDVDSMSLVMLDRAMPRRAQLAPTLWSVEQRTAAGAGAIAFAASISPINQPAGWKTLIGNAEAFYVDSDGRVTDQLVGAISPMVWRSGLNATSRASHFWLVPRSTFDMARENSARLRIDYSVSQLAPSVSADLAVDGARRYITGLGYCSAKSDKSTRSVTVDCFKRGEQPALLIASLPEFPGNDDAPSGFPDYTPAAMEFLSGAEYKMTLRHGRDAIPTGANVTAYEVRGHFNRSLIAPGLLGGSDSECPAPQVSQGR